MVCNSIFVFNAICVDAFRCSVRLFKRGEGGSAFNVNLTLSVNKSIFRQPLVLRFCICVVFSGSLSGRIFVQDLLGRDWLQVAHVRNSGKSSIITFVRFGDLFRFDF